MSSGALARLPYLKKSALAREYLDPLQREIAKQAVKIKKGSDPISRMRRMLTLGAGATALASIVPRAWAVLAAAKRSLAENPLIGARRQALVIGNSNYAKAGVLRNPRNDGSGSGSHRTGCARPFVPIASCAIRRTTG